MKKFKAIILLVSIFLLSVSMAYADSVAYILSNVNHPEQELIGILVNMGFTVDKIDNDNINTVNLSKYSFMLINDDVFSNYNQIPVNNFPALILNRNHIDKWHWTSKVSQKSSSQPLTAYVNNPNEFITNGFPSNIQIYSSSAPSVAYLHRYYRAPQLKTILSVDNTTSLNKLNAIIATAVPGTLLRDGVTSNVKSVFFGITENDYWSARTGQLFRNSVLWLTTDLIPPTISNLAITNITNSSALISWDTNKNSNATVLYGKNLSLSNSKPDSTKKLHQQILLNDLSEETFYYYKAKSCNGNNYCSESGIFNFTTLDLTAPYLVSHEENDLTNSSVTVSVNINEQGYSRIYYGANQENLEQSTPQSTLGTSANFKINSLNEETTYYYSVNMCDDSTNCRNSSVFSFSTLDLTAPYLLSHAENNLTNSSINISVDINEDGYSRIYYGTNPSALVQSTPQSALGTSANFEINSLNEETTYHYLAEMCDDSANCRNSSTFSFATLDLTAPYLVSKVGSNLTNSSIKISVEINELGYSKIYYGTSPASLNQVTPQSALETSADFQISSLNEKTKYYYEVNICDDSTNCRNSSVFDFTTLDLTEPNAPKNLILEIINSDNNIKIKWDSALDDAVNYNIYISDTPNNFDFSAPNATTANNEYTDNTASTVKQRYYVVRAVDGAGNEETNTYVVGKYDLELSIGYNLVALPLAPFSNDIDDVMHQTVSYNPVSEVKKFDNSAQEFKTNSWVIAAWNPLAFQELNYGEGYFFKSKQNIDFTIVGTLPETAVLGIKQGMNLFGIASLENKNIDEVIIQTPADYNVTELGKRNTDGTYSLATYYPNPSSWNNAFTLEPGIGYWLKANQDFNLELNP